MQSNQNEILPLPVDPSTHRIKVVINVFCSDSRNVTQDYYDSKEKVLDDLERNGVRVDFEKINDPGAFMTQATIDKIKKMILKRETVYSSYAAAGVPIEYDIHVVAHGNAHRKPEYASQKAHHPHQLEIMECCTNCGMRHAETAVKALQDFIVGAKPVFTVNGQPMRIESHEDLRAYMKIHFKGHGYPDVWDGDLLSWLEPVKDILTHPNDQIAKFEKAIASDPKFGAIAGRIKTFGEVLNYSNRGLHRVDGKEHQADEVLRPIFKHERTNGQKGDSLDVTTPQPTLNPILLISGTLYNTRKLVAKHFLNKGDGKVGGRVFSIAGDTDPGNFNPYAAVGFFYALSPQMLNKKDDGKMVVLGRDKPELMRLLDKIDNDNIVKLVINHHAKIINQMVDPRQNFRHRNPNTGGSTSPQGQINNKH